MSQRDSIDLNADVGEGAGCEEELIPLVSSVNIACGAHAGDARTMRQALEIAGRHGAAVGAHPGFADPGHFGRRELPVSPAAAAELVLLQARRLEEMAAGVGLRVGHVKLHGALYNMAARDPSLGAAIVEALAREERAGHPRWRLFTLAGSSMEALGRAAGLSVLAEAFADRTYTPGGGLTPRSEPGALIVDEDAAVRQALRIAGEGTIVATDGSVVPVRADTLCLHGDGPRAVAFARRIRMEFARAGISVRC